MAKGNYSNPLNKNLKYDSSVLQPEYERIPYESTIGTDQNSFSKEDLGNQSLEDFQKSTNTGTSVINKQVLSDQNYFNKLKQTNATIQNDINAYNQSTLDKVGNGLVKFGGRVYTSVAGSTIGTLYGLYSWAKDGEFKSFYDNDFQRSLDGINDYLAEEFKHYYTSDQSDWEIQNFIFDKVFDGLGFATGAILSSYIGGGVTNAFTKSLKLTNAIKSNSVKKLVELSKNNLPQDVLEHTTKTLNTISRVNQLNQLPKTMVSLATGAVYESGVEARHSYNETRELLIDIYKQTHEGKSPTGNDLEQLNQMAGETANAIFATNMVLVGGGNILQFGKHLGLDYRDLTKVFKSSIAKEVITETGEKVIKSTGSKLLRGTKAVIKNPLVESQEEMIQSVISGTGKDYTINKYKNNGKADLNDLISSSIKAFKKTYGTSEGWEEGLIGAIVGSAGVITPRSSKTKEGKFQIPVQLVGGIKESVSDWKQDEAKREEIIQKLNTQGSVESLKSGIKHNIRDYRNEVLKDEAILSDNELLYKNAQDDQFHSFVTSRIEAGMIESVYDNLSSIKSIPLEDYKKSFGIPEDVDFTETDRSKQISSFERRTKSIENSVKFVDRVYRGNDPDVKEALIYNQSMSGRIKERMNNISNEINELTGGNAQVNFLNEKGERLSKSETFKNVPKEFQINKFEYEKLHDDYIKLLDRSDKMLDETLELLDVKRESKIEEDIKQSKTQSENAQEAQRLKKEKESKLQNKEKKADEIKNKKQQKVDTVKDIEDTQKASENLNTSKAEDEIQMSTEDQLQLIKNIWNTVDSKQLTSLLNQSGLDINRLPQNIKEALDKKIQQLGVDKSEIEKGLIDPLNTTIEVKPDDVISFEKNEATNNGVSEEAPNDITKNKEALNDLNSSNNGNIITGLNGEEVQDDGIPNIDGRLIDAFNSVAINTRPFTEDEKGNKTDLNTLNLNSNLDVLSSELLQEGDQVIIDLYTESELQIFNTDGTVKQTLQNEFGENQIMQVKDLNDRLIGYIHDESYIRPDRVVDLKDNIERNKRELRRVRSLIYNHINDIGTPYKTKILGKRSGTVFTLANKRYDVSLKDALLEDKRPQLLIVKEDGFYIGKQKLTDTKYKDLVISSYNEDFFKKYKGSTMIIIPGANGKYITEFVRNPKLQEIPTISKLITDILEAFVEGNTDFIESIGLEDNKQSIDNFIQQFIFYSETDITSPYRLTIFEDRNIRFTDLNGQRIPLYNKQKQSEYGTNNNQSLQKLKDRINNSYLNVNAKLYDENPYIRIKDSNGVLKDIKYNTFLKDNLKVNFKGNEISLSNGKKEVIYTYNPVISLDFNGVSQISSTNKIETKPEIDETGGLFTKQEFEVNTKDIKKTSLSKLRTKKSKSENKVVSLFNEEVSQEEINKRKDNCK